MRLTPTGAGASFSKGDLLRWLFVGRLTLAAGIFVGIVVVWEQARPEETLIASVLFILALLATGGSFWWAFVGGRETGENFSYLQVTFDALLVTGIVHITGGAESVFAPLYILVVTTGALLLPLRGGILLAILASMLFLADSVWFHEGTVAGTLGLQLGLFTVVALVTGWVADRLRRAGMALGAVESELRQLRLDTSDILDKVTSGVLTVDGEGRLAYLNETGEELLGIQGRQWMGAPVVDVVGTAAPGLATILRNSIRDQIPVSRYKVRARRDGQDVTLGVSTTILEREGDPEGPPSVTALFQDITDQEQLDALNRRTERLEAVAELSASLAHEIKNPLASIRSAVEQLTRPSVDEGDQATLRRLVVGESERLSRLLSEFIDYSALRMRNEGDVDLAALVRDSVELGLQHPDTKNGPGIECAGVDGQIWIPGDRDLLHRAIFNLVLNALQFSGPDGRVRIEVSKLGDRASPRGTGIPDAVRLKVKDSGPGIDPQEVGRIFDPFYTTRPGGSGLGLAVVHRAVEAHRGAVFVDSPSEGGSEFVIYLPGTRHEREVPSK